MVGLPRSTFLSVNNGSQKTVPLSQNLYATLTHPSSGSALPEVSSPTRGQWQGGQDLSWPVPGGIITSGVGWRWGRNHTGLDIAAPSTSENPVPVQAIASGRIAKIVPALDPYNNGFGNYMVIESVDPKTQQPFYTIYAHMDHFQEIQTAHGQTTFTLKDGTILKEGQTITQDQQIGNVGSTGNSTGPHLHLEMHTGMVPANPLELTSSETLMNPLEALKPR